MDGNTITSTIADVGLTSRADALTGDLSGGERIRVSLAAALLADPELYLLDEPTVGLDPVLRRDLWKMFRDLADDGKTLLVSSHVMDEAGRCDRVLLMRDGELIADATPDELRTRGWHRRSRGSIPRPRRGNAHEENLGHRRRVLQQLSHDRRSIALIVLLPSILLALFKYIYDGQPAIFNRVGPQMLGLFPFIVMFLVTSVTMVRERTSGTLERLLTTSLKRGELIGGYAIAFGIAALVQALVSAGVAIWLLDLDVQTPWAIVLFAVVDAVLGTALGLLMSAFARTEFQAVQFMPLVVVPQILLCGLLTPRDSMPKVLNWISDALPLSYATDSFSELASSDVWSGTLGRNLGVLVGCCAVAIALASLTLRRRTP